MRRITAIVMLAMFSLALVQSARAEEESKEVAQLKAKISKLESQNKDWANLNRYGKSNSELAPPAENENRVVFLGDSITDNWSKPGYGGFFPEKPYVNRGISGQTTPQMLLRFRPDVIALKPKVVVILAGTNDLSGNTGPTTLDAIEGNLTSIVELAKANGIRVVLASLLPVSDYEKNKEGKTINQTNRRPPEQIKALNEWIKKYAAENDCVFLDYYSATADDQGFLKDELSNDGLHPNTKGYEIMGPLAEQAISKALENK